MKTLSFILQSKMDYIKFLNSTGTGILEVHYMKNGVSLIFNKYLAVLLN